MCHLGYCTCSVELRCPTCFGRGETVTSACPPSCPPAEFGCFLSNYSPGIFHRVTEFPISPSHAQFSSNYCPYSYQPIQSLLYCPRRPSRRFQNHFYCFDYRSDHASSSDLHFAGSSDSRHVAFLEDGRILLARALLSPSNLNCSSQCY